MTRIQIVQEAFRKFEGGDFVYGAKDCCQFAGWVAKEITGVDYLKEFVYASEEEAYEIIRDAGGFEALLERVLGPGQLSGFLPGDPVLVELPVVGPALSVWYADKPCVLFEKRFLQCDPNRIIKGWAI
jgi:hypothetical protein